MEQASQFVPKKKQKSEFYFSDFFVCRKSKMYRFFEAFLVKKQHFTLKIAKVEIFLLKRLQGM